MTRGMVHDLTLVAPGEDYRDHEGRWTRVGQPVTVRGRISAGGQGPTNASASAQQAVGTATIVVADAVALVPLSSQVDTEYQVVAAGAGFPLDGTYEIESVVRTQAHFRLALRRQNA